MKIESNNITQTERKHIKLFIDSGHTQSKINNKHYTIVKGDLKTLEIEIKLKDNSKMVVVYR